MENTKEVIAIFDFDNTITKSDSMLRFLFYTHTRSLFVKKSIQFSVFYFLYKLNLMSNHVAKEKLFTIFFKGTSDAFFENLCENFSKHKLSKIINPEAIKKIKWHKSQNHKVIIISSSVENWIKPWAGKNDIDDILGTKVEILDGLLTGKFIGKICYGEEKVCRFEEKFGNPQKYYLYVYGDSNGDKELLAIADEKFYRKF